MTKQTLSNPPGKVCMAGTSLGYAALTLGLGTGPGQPCGRNGELACAFDVKALGITQLEFTLETPPSGGVLPELDDVAISDMPPSGFDWAGGRVSTTTTRRASLSDFQYPGLTLEPSKLVALAFTVSAAEHYDFCVRDLKFLNAAGVEVLPTP